MREIVFALVCLLQVTISSAFYAVGFHAGTEQRVRLLNVGSTFRDAPTIEQLADVYSRLSGQAPLLWEGKSLNWIFDLILSSSRYLSPIDDVNVPTAENLSSMPLLLEVESNEVFPPSITTIASTQFVDGSLIPSLDDVLTYLKSNGIECEGKKIEVCFHLKRYFILFVRTISYFHICTYLYILASWPLFVFESYHSCRSSTTWWIRF